MPHLQRAGHQQVAGQRLHGHGQPATVDEFQQPLEGAGIDGGRQRQARPSTQQQLVVEKGRGGRQDTSMGSEDTATGMDGDVAELALQPQAIQRVQQRRRVPRE